METINGIPNITTNTPYLPNIQINGTGIRLIRNIRGANVNVRDVRLNHIADTRSWIVEPPEALPIEVPVTTLNALKFRGGCGQALELVRTDVTLWSWVYCWY